MAIEVLGLLAAGIGATYGWWSLHRRRDARTGLQVLEAAMDGDSAVAFSVASHAMTSRGQSAMVPLHLLYGLLQDQTFTSAIERLGGVPDAIETRVLAELDKPITDIETASHFVGSLLSYVYAVAQATERTISIVDLWAGLTHDDVAKLVEVDAHTLLFLLAHGIPAPEPDLPGRTDAQVILRNDNYTSQEFVSTLLREVFELSAEDAHARMLDTHTHGKAVVARYRLPVARDKVLAARTRAHEACFPLWVALEDC